MKLVAEHLGEIILAIAGIALLVGVILAFEPVIGQFFENIVEQLNAVANGDIWSAPSWTPDLELTLAP